MFFHFFVFCLYRQCFVLSFLDTSVSSGPLHCLSREPLEELSAPLAGVIVFRSTLHTIVAVVSQANTLEVMLLCIA